MPAELCASQPVPDQIRLGCADEQSARDLLLCMYDLVCHVVGYHKRFRQEKKLALTWQARGGSKLPSTASADQEYKMLVLNRCYLGNPCMLCYAVL